MSARGLVLAALLIGVGWLGLDRVGAAEDRTVDIVADTGSSQEGVVYFDNTSFDDAVSGLVDDAVTIGLPIPGLAPITGLATSYEIDDANDVVALRTTAPTAFDAPSPLAGALLDVLVVGDWDDENSDLEPAITLAFRATGLSLAQLQPAWSDVDIPLGDAVVALTDGVPVTIDPDQLPVIAADFFDVGTALDDAIVLGEVSNLIATVDAGSSAIGDAFNFLGVSGLPTVTGSLSDTAAQLFDADAAFDAAAFAVSGPLAIDASGLPDWLRRGTDDGLASPVVELGLATGATVHDVIEIVTGAVTNAAGYEATIADLATGDITIDLDSFVEPYGLDWLEPLDADLHVTGASAVFDIGVAMGGASPRLLIPVDATAPAIAELDIDATVALTDVAAWLETISALGSIDFASVALGDAELLNGTLTYDPTTGVVGLLGEVTGLGVAGSDLRVRFLIGASPDHGLLAALHVDDPGCSDGCVSLDEVLPVGEGSLAGELLLPSIGFVQITQPASFPTAALGSDAVALLEQIDADPDDGSLHLSVDVPLGDLAPLFAELHLTPSADSVHLEGAAGFALPALDDLGAADLTGLDVSAAFAGVAATAPAGFPAWLTWPGTGQWSLYLAYVDDPGGLTIGARVEGITLDTDDADLGLTPATPELTLDAAFAGDLDADPSTWKITATASIGTWPQPFGIPFLTVDEAHARITIEDAGDGVLPPEAELCGTFTIGSGGAAVQVEICAAIGADLTATLTARLHTAVTMDDVVDLFLADHLAQLGVVGDLPEFLQDASVGPAAPGSPPSELVFTVTANGRFSIDGVIEVGFMPFSQPITGNVLFSAAFDGPATPTVTLGFSPTALSLSALLPEGVLPAGFEFDLVPPGPDAGFALMFSTAPVDPDSDALPERVRKFYAPLFGGSPAGESIPAHFSILGAFTLPEPLAELVEGLGVQPNVLLGGSIPLPGMDELSASMHMRLRLAEGLDLPEFIDPSIPPSLTLSAAISIPTDGLPSFSLSLGGKLYLRFKQGLDPELAAAFSAIGLELPAATPDPSSCERGGFIQTAAIDETTSESYCYDVLGLELGGSLTLALPSSVDATLIATLRSCNGSAPSADFCSSVSINDPYGWSPFGLDAVLIDELVGSVSLGLDPIATPPITLKLGLSGSVSLLGYPASMAIQAGVGVDPKTSPIPTVTPLFDGFRIALPEGIGLAQLLQIQHALGGPEPSTVNTGGLPDLSLRNLHFAIGLDTLPHLCIEPGLAFGGDLYIDPSADAPTIAPDCVDGELVTPADHECIDHQAEGCFAGVEFSLDSNGVLAEGFVAPFEIDPLNISVDETYLRLALRTDEPSSLVLRGGVTIGEGDGQLGQGSLALSLAADGGSFYGFITAFDAFTVLLRADLDLSNVSILDPSLPPASVTAVLQADFRDLATAKLTELKDGMLDAFGALQEKMDAVAGLADESAAKFQEKAAALGIDLPEWIAAVGDAIAAFEADVEATLESLGEVFGVKVILPTSQELFEGGEGAIRHNPISVVCGFGESYSSTRERCVTRHSDGSIDEERGEPTIICVPGISEPIINRNGTPRCQALIPVPPIGEVVSGFTDLPSTFAEAIADLRDKVADKAIQIVTGVADAVGAPSLADLEALLDSLPEAIALECASFSFDSASATGPNVDASLRIVLLGQEYGISVPSFPLVEDPSFQEVFDALMQQLVAGDPDADGCTDTLAPPGGVDEDELVSDLVTVHSPTQLREGGTVTLDGTFSDDPGERVVSVDWGDDSDVEEPDVVNGEFSLDHQYEDDPPGSGIIYRIRVFLDGVPVTTHVVSVKNVAPVATVDLSSTDVDEGRVVTLDISATDDGKLDTHHAVVTWGDGTTQTVDLPLVRPLGHRFADDGESETPEDDVEVTVQVFDDDGGIDTERRTLTVHNVDPVLTSTIPSSGDEAAAIDFTVTWVDPGSLDSHTVVVDWGDGTTDVVQPEVGDREVSVQHTYADDDPTGTPSDDYEIDVSLTDDDSGFAQDVQIATIANVAPTVGIELSATTIEELDSVTVSGSFVDPGTADTHTVTIDWGHDDLAPTTIELDAGDRTFEATERYGDNSGSAPFTITATVVDDDTGEGAGSESLTVTNVAPEAAISRAGSRSINGNDTFLTTIGQSNSFDAGATDPGSDDLAFEWSFGNGTASGTSLVPGETGADPLPSPTVAPRQGTEALTDARSATYSMACLYLVTFTATDDDGGSDDDHVHVVAFGTETLRRTAGYWYQQYAGKGGNLLSLAQRQCYLDIANHLSASFEGVTIAQAKSILDSPSKPTALQKLDRQLLAAWLNVATGSLGYDQLVDTDGDGTRDTAFSTYAAAVESRRLTATDSQRQADANRLEAINLGNA